jgi:sulfatase modifying factor 1
MELAVSKHLIQESREIRTKYLYFQVVGVLIAVALGCQVGSTPVDGLGQSLAVSETNSLGMEFCLIQPQKDRETSPDSKTASEGSDSTLALRPFYLGVHEVTMAQFRTFVEESGYLTDAESDEIRGGLGLVNKVPTQDKPFSWRETGFLQSDQHPVVNVSWNDAQAFVEWLSEKEGRCYRLPTEAEWEFACSAGANTPFSNGDDPDQLFLIANIADRSFAAEFPNMKGPTQSNDGFPFTAPVGSFAPNVHGLFDMHGNVSEWCSNWWSPAGKRDISNPFGPRTGSFKVFRGGSWLSYSWQATVQTRQYISPSLRDYTIGFRVLLEPLRQSE